MLYLQNNSVTRIIPRLDIKGPNVVKGIHLEGLRVIGQPDQMARHYYQAGADELFFMDVVASLYERNSLTEIITQTAKEIFIPLTVGGGIRSIEDIDNVLRAGADKVCLNTAAIKTPEIIREASRCFGSSTIVIAIEAIQERPNHWLAYTDNGREYTGLDVLMWARKVEELGAGEIVITSVDRDGTGNGFDCDLVRQVSEIVSIPIVAHGGAGASVDVVNVIRNGKADAVALGSMLHYDYVRENDHVKVNNQEGNYAFLQQKRDFHKFDTATVGVVKEELERAGVNTRPWNS